MRFNRALTEDRFDQLTERLATASMSRRGAIGMIGGVFAGAVASTSFGIDRAFARPTQLPLQIYVVRHGEKPPEPAGPPFGVDRNQNSLSPRGWQRSGALTVLFSPAGRAESGAAHSGGVVRNGLWGRGGDEDSPPLRDHPGSQSPARHSDSVARPCRAGARIRRPGSVQRRRGGVGLL